MHYDGDFVKPPPKAKNNAHEYLIFYFFVFKYI